MISDKARKEKLCGAYNGTGTQSGELRFIECIGISERARIIRNSDNFIAIREYQKSVVNEYLHALEYSRRWKEPVDVEVLKRAHI